MDTCGHLFLRKMSLQVHPIAGREDDGTSRRQESNEIRVQKGLSEWKNIDLSNE